MIKFLKKFSHSFKLEIFTWQLFLNVVIVVFFSHETKTVAALLDCLQCRGINCQRTAYNLTKQCADELDICVTVFEGQSVRAQGCFLHLPSDLRAKCEGIESGIRGSNFECHKCNTNHCNSLGPPNYECIQCDSRVDNRCHLAQNSLPATRCAISRTMNSFCFVQTDGQNTKRGCAGSLAVQRDCLQRKDCFLCSPFEISECNRVQVGQVNENIVPNNDLGNKSESSNSDRENNNNTNENDNNSISNRLNNTIVNYTQINSYSESGNGSIDNGNTNTSSSTSRNPANQSEINSASLSDSGSNSNSGSMNGSNSTSVAESESGHNMDSQSNSGSVSESDSVSNSGAESDSNSLDISNGGLDSLNGLSAITKILLILYGIIIALISLK